jgi:hypothetical protein
MDNQGLSERHLLLFGSIANWFARYERLMAEAMASSPEPIFFVSVALMTRRLSFEEKRRALLNIFRSTWVVHRELNSIQSDWILKLPPSIRPSLGALDDDLIKGEDEKVGYTIDDLTDVVRSLSLNYAAFADYIKEIQPTT